MHTKRMILEINHGFFDSRPVVYSKYLQIDHTNHSAKYNNTTNYGKCTALNFQFLIHPNIPTHTVRCARKNKMKEYRNIF